jgi:hypothetical protein
MNYDNQENWPVDLHGKPIPPCAQPGYYAGYSTLSQRNFWDAATRNAVMRRIENIPAVRFFSQDEAHLLEAVANSALPQDDRDQMHRIAIVPWIDERLYEGRTDGYRFEGMPPDGEAYKLGLRGIDACAYEAFRRSFVELESIDRGMILQSIHNGKPAGGHAVWKRLQVHRFWLLLLHDICQVYYAHPWAWDEIGYGGPAYPRGYMRLENGEPEPWEVREQRYQWEPPLSSRSSKFDLIAGLEDHYGSPGQGGTH